LVDAFNKTQAIKYDLISQPPTQSHNVIILYTITEKKEDSTAGGMLCQNNK